MRTTTTGIKPNPGTDFDTAVVDLDGTLIDSSYHQLMAWSQAFAQAGIPVPSYRLHALMGMGGDRLVAAATNDSVEESLGDTLRSLWKHNYNLLQYYVHPLEGALDLLAALESHGLKVVIASSGDPQHTQHALGLLHLRRETPVIDADDADGTKPAPDLVRAAVRRVGGRDAVMIGDTRWDAEAAAKCGYPTIALRTGGIGVVTLGGVAAAVYATPRELADHLDEALALAADSRLDRPRAPRLRVVRREDS